MREKKMSSEAVEYVRGIPVVKTFGQTVFSFKRFKLAIDEYESGLLDTQEHDASDDDMLHHCGERHFCGAYKLRLSNSLPMELRTSLFLIFLLCDNNFYSYCNAYEDSMQESHRCWWTTL